MLIVIIHQHILIKDVILSVLLQMSSSIELNNFDFFYQSNTLAQSFSTIMIANSNYFFEYLTIFDYFLLYMIILIHL